MALKLDAWDCAPRRIAVDGRGARVGWFRAMAMAADAANRARPAEILAAAGIVAGDDEKT